MTKKIVKWYKKMRFWNFVGFIVAPLVIGGEGAIISLEGDLWLHLLVFGAICIAGYIKYYVKDENNDGIVD